MIVVDVNLLIALVLAPRDSDLVRRAYKRDRVWAVPALWRAEFLNALVTMVRRRELTRSAADAAWREAEKRFSVNEQDVDEPRVLRIAHKYMISGYDAHYVALADELGVPLVTNDLKSLASKCPESLVVHLSSFAS